MEKKYILSLDQGTTSSRAVLFTKNSEIVGISQRTFPQIYPDSGWVEHDPLDIWLSQEGAMMDVLRKTGISPEEIITIGIANQRETAVLWDRITGKPVYNAIVWQCRRTAGICEELKERGIEDYVRHTTGLLLDAYFSGTKIKWIFDNVPGVLERAEQGNILFGTVDSWLLWNLTGGRVHATDITNASRTMLFNIRKREWDNKLLAVLHIPPSVLPEVKASSDSFGVTNPGIFDGISIPITGVAGDQHAALFGQCCFQQGSVKNTYGTGCFIVMNTGEEIVYSKNRMLTTIAWQLENEVEYALEGSVFMAGAVISWLKEELNLLESDRESDTVASSVPDTRGVYVVPAFVGLGAPYWDMYARGTIVGLTRDVNKKHIIRASLEAIAYRSKDVLDALSEDSGMPLKMLKVDGGASKNNFLMQFQSDILDIPVIRPKVQETTALGAAFLAGLKAGVWDSKENIVSAWEQDTEFVPSLSPEKRRDLYTGWQKAVKRSAMWLQD